MKHDPRLDELEEIGRDRALTIIESDELDRRLAVDRRRISRRVARVIAIRAKVERLRFERNKLALRRWRYQRQIDTWLRRLRAAEVDAAPELADTIEQELRG